MPLVDRRVCVRKFERELSQFSKLSSVYNQRGCFLTKVTFPIAELLFCTTRVRPATIVFGARINFENYDYWAPSVVLIDPFTGQPYLANTLPTVLPRRVPGTDGFTVMNLAQAHVPDQKPFLCFAGVREYHDHPAHTADSWLRHRRNGEGTLTFLVDQLFTYGVQPISGLQLDLQVRISGFKQDMPPL